LTGPDFLAKYKKILATGGQLNLKTDDQTFFAYSLDSIAFSGGIILQKKIIDPLNEADQRLLISTFYEQLHLRAGKNIYYLQAKFI